MKRNFRIATMFYLILLGITLGAGLFAGAIVAPVIFNSEEFLGSNILTHYQEGLLMTQNFIKLAYLVDFSVIVVALYEGYKYKMFERDKLTQMATFLFIATGLMFGHYYMPDIINLQLAGEQMTNSQTFVNIHKGSEIDFKIFTLATLVLIIQNMRKACR
jgi:hypothetical protein